VKLRYVESAPFFSALSEQEQEMLSQRMHLEHRRSGETLFQQGTDSRALYLVKSGWVRLITNGGIAIASQGPGSLVGETDLFLDRPRSHGAVIATDAEIWVLDKLDLSELISASPQIGLKLTFAFGSRLALLDQYLVARRLKPQSFLSSLTDESLTAIAHRLTPMEKKEGELVVEAGQPPKALFIVESGHLHLHSSEEGGDFSELGPGETFGEMAVLTGKPHAHSAQAATDVILWALPAADFETLAEQHPDIRLALSKSIREPLLSGDQERAVDRLAKMSLFEGLPDEILWAVSQRLLLNHVPAGELVFAEGAPGDALYLVDSGQVEIVSGERQGGTVLARLGADEFFGEMALLTGKPRSSAARAATHTNLWVLYRTDFDDLVNRYPAISLALSRVLSQRLADMDRRFTETHLRNLKLLAGLSPSQMDDISRRLRPARYRQGEEILHEGDPGKEMFFIESGRVQVTHGRGASTLVLAELGAGDLFGEMALLTGNPRSASVTALSDVDLWSMSQGDFDNVVIAYPNLALALSRLLSERLRSTDDRYLRQPAEPVTPPVPSRTRSATQTTLVVPAPTRRPAPKPHTTVQPVPRPRSTVQAAPITTQAAPARTRTIAKKPSRNLSAEVRETFEGLAAWYGTLSRAAKVRLLLVTMLFIWLVCVAAPALVISTLAAEDVTNLQGAIAFVYTATPVPTNTSLPTHQPLASVALAEIPTNTPTVEAAAPAETMILEEAMIAQAPALVPNSPEPTEPAVGEIAPTATPWVIVVTNTPPPATDTPIPPTDTPVPPAPIRAPNRSIAAAAAPAATAVPADRPQPPRELDPRLGSLGVVVDPVTVAPGQKYWRLIKARWQNQQESGNDHTIYIEVLDEDGGRLPGQQVEVRWQDGSLALTTENKPAYEYPTNFPMYNCLGSYSVRVSGLPSDAIEGLGMGTAEQPHFTIHTNFFLTFQRVTR
jgi:CRP-like cAMP-binding protein